MIKEIATDAWVLYRGSTGVAAELKRENFSFPELTEHEILLEPIYGCWEGNMTHALERNPIDVCEQRQEEKVVIGNGGVLRILRVGRRVTNLHEGDLGLYFFVGVADENGYMMKIAGYDAPKSIGMLAKQIKLHEKQFIPLPRATCYSLKQWAAFCARYLTAWSNWRVAYGTWRLQMTEEDMPVASVWGWGGGTTLAELQLAKHFGCDTFMIASKEQRLQLLQKMGIATIDRRQFLALMFDANLYKTNAQYREEYKNAETCFLSTVMHHTAGRGASIFIDNIGYPVFRATLKSLSRQGVVTTVGWKKGMDLQVIRAIECIYRHSHIFTHGTRYSESLKAVQFAEETAWLPPDTNEVYSWDDVPQLANDYAQEKTVSYFPLYQINPE